MHINNSNAIKKYIIGNWKSNKTKNEVSSFFKSLKENLNSSNNISYKDIELAVCPSFVHLELSKQLVEELKLPLTLGAQDISPFESGAFTGEVNGSQLKEYVKYVIIGHSERRNHFQESENLLRLKVFQAKKYGINVIFCVPDSKTSIPKEVNLIAYEPVFAIGTGKSDTPQNANNVIKEIKNKNSNIPVIYGGSVTDVNIADFLNKDSIDGVLPGKASLDAETFYRMLINAAS